jgi:hypothetical protein
MAALMAVILASAVSCNRRAIARAQAEATALATERDSLVAVVGERERRLTALGIQRDTLQASLARVRAEVSALEGRRAAAQLDVRQIETVGALQQRLRATFPELGDSAWGLTTVRLRGDTLGLDYLMVPAWFAETFVIDHANAQSWRQQRDRLLVADSLQRAVTALQDSIARLASANARAYAAGYEAAYTGYQDLSRRYVAELRRPRITVGRSIQLVAAVGAGFLLAQAVK